MKKIIPRNSKHILVPGILIDVYIIRLPPSFVSLHTYNDNITDQR